jgi:hypothetical protein
LRNSAVAPVARLEDLLRIFRISKQLDRKVEGIKLIRLKREERIRISVSVLSPSLYVDYPSAVCWPITPL